MQRLIYPNASHGLSATSEFLVDCNGVKTVKIGQQTPKIFVKIKIAVFETQWRYYTEVASKPDNDEN